MALGSLYATIWGHFLRFFVLKCSEMGGRNPDEYREDPRAQWKDLCTSKTDWVPHEGDTGIEQPNYHAKHAILDSQNAELS